MKKNVKLSNFQEIKNIINSGISSNCSSSKEIQSFLCYINDSYYILCKKCKTIPLLQYESLSKIIISCECTKNLSIDIYDFNKNFIIDKEEYEQIPEIEYNLKCIEHKNKFKYYCLNHRQHLCEDCQKIHSCDKKNIINLDEEKSILDKEIISGISKNLMNDNDKQNNLDVDICIILIICLINNYNENPNYNFLVNIKNNYKILKNDEASEKEEYKKYIRINSKREYEKLNDDKRNDIKYISIISKNTDICFLKNARLTNLQELNMQSNILMI